MEIIPGITINLSFIVSIMVKISMILVLVLSMVMVRQESLMNKVVNFPIGGGFKILTWGFMVFTLLMTIIVLIA